ncbi:hypothetical protein CYMTET_52963 [Cymbomonas tetramitiformis]|uniref:Uncharacterized protein n=1 Tax=Cymbomonas tetramitiformis TaxID=36881 RepID=A0AAE0BJQ2_9CHLO|nr:hypothetical protein CYMTET_52963 [Cymbomonas tetramitiformis]
MDFRTTKLAVPSLLTVLSLAFTQNVSADCSAWLQVHLAKTGGTFFRRLGEESADITSVRSADEAAALLRTNSSAVVECEYHVGFGIEHFTEWEQFCNQCDCIWHINIRQPHDYYKSMLQDDFLHGVLTAQAYKELTGTSTARDRSALKKSVHDQPDLVSEMLPGALVKIILRFAGEEYHNITDWKLALRQSFKFLRRFDIVGRTRDNFRTAGVIGRRLGINLMGAFPQKHYHSESFRAASSHNLALDKLHDKIITNALEKNSVDQDLYESTFFHCADEDDAP